MEMFEKTPLIAIKMAYLNLSDISEKLTLDVIRKIFTLKTLSPGGEAKARVERAGPAGEGLISAVYRIIVSNSNDTASFIAKGLVSDLLLRKTLSCEKLFAREITFYSEILPALMDAQKTLNAKESIQKYVPVCYKCYCDSQQDYIILDDLSEKGFKTISDRANPHQKNSILKTIAHLHAVSTAMRITNPELFYKFAKQYPEFYYNSDRKEWYSKYLKSAIDIDIEVISEFENNSIYYEKFMNVVNSDVYQNMIDIVSTWGEHVVLNHGDVWCPNFMSNNDHVVAIDYQLFRFASPATDLCFFLFCNITDTSSVDDFMRSIDTYYEYLGYFLRDMSLEVEGIFPKDDLYEELRKFGRFGFFAALSTIPLVASEKCDVMSSFSDKFSGFDVIPLERLWQLTPIASHEHKMRLVSALRVAVDTGIL